MKKLNNSSMSSIEGGATGWFQALAGGFLCGAGLVMAAPTGGLALGVAAVGCAVIFDAA